MTIWRMAFRCGSQGYNMWDRCHTCNVAAVAYDPQQNTDLSRFPPMEPEELWSELYPSQKASLRRVAYEMKRGDIIYVKSGRKIVCRGKVTGAYQFDRPGIANRLVEPNG